VNEMTDDRRVLGFWRGHSTFHTSKRKRGTAAEAAAGRRKKSPATGDVIIPADVITRDQ
jgi:hypothetical protein